MLNTWKLSPTTRADPKFATVTVPPPPLAPKMLPAEMLLTLPPEMFGFYKRHIDFISDHAVDPQLEIRAPRGRGVRAAEGRRVEGGGPSPWPLVPPRTAARDGLAGSTREGEH